MWPQTRGTQDYEMLACHNAACIAAGNQSAVWFHPFTQKGGAHGAVSKGQGVARTNEGKQHSLV